MKAIPHSLFEPYLFYKTNPRVTGERGATGSLGRWTAGWRRAPELPSRT